MTPRQPYEALNALSELIDRELAALSPPRHTHALDGGRNDTAIMELLRTTQRTITALRPGTHVVPMPIGHSHGSYRVDVYHH